jgi:hypothetical protein
MASQSSDYQSSIRTYLQPNDWYVVREQEAGTAIPADWTTFRSGVRSTAADMQSKINACTNSR